MSYTFSGTNARLEGQFSSTYGGTDISMFCWFKMTDHPAAVDILLCFGNSSTLAQDQYDLSAHSTDNVMRVRSLDSAATIAAAGFTLTAGEIDGNWIPMLGCWSADDASRDIYILTPSNTNNNAGSKTVGNTLQFIRLAENFAGGNDYTGLLAEAAIWNTRVDTNSQNVTDLLTNKYAPSLIEPSNLLGYWSLKTDTGSSVANESSVDSGGDLTTAGTAAFDADHPAGIVYSLGDVPSLYVIRSGIRLA